MRFKILLLLFLASCMASSSGRRLQSTNLNSTNFNGSGNGSSGGNGSLGGTTAINPTVELTHFINPYEGSFVQKLSIPKNYKGTLYIAGLNLSTLNNKSIKVRFKFGRELHVVEIPAILGKTRGVTPSVDVDLLVLDLANMPFENIYLPYDLYDYNEYTFDGLSGSTVLTEPVSDNKNRHLFCRGLDLVDDPTFTSTSGSCSSATDECKYAYAKVRDVGLYKDLGSFSVPIYPRSMQVKDSGGATYYDQSASALLNKCTPDDPSLNFSLAPVPHLFKFSLTPPTPIYFNYPDLSKPIGLDNYSYKGPYEINDFSHWQITASAMNSASGIFRRTDVGGSVSNLFPRYAKQNLSVGTRYIGAALSALPDDPKTEQIMTASGLSTWMDGCNERVRSFNSYTNEHVGSCTVNASIEVVVTDMATSFSQVVTKSKDIKLQLLKESLTDQYGNDVLSSTFGNCSSSASCGADNCCLNGKCWDKAVIGLCPDEQPAYDNQIIGSSCSSDLSCASLCCDSQTAQCAPHDTISGVLCQKHSGEFCIGREWCETYSKRKCTIVRTGPGPFACALTCENVAVHGLCNQGMCQDPGDFDPPEWDEFDPDRCDGV